GTETVTLREPIQVKQPSCATHLALNKSSYRVGEVLFFRTLTLERFSLKPPAENIALRYTLRDPQGKALIQRENFTGPGGVGGGEFALTDSLADGDYTLEVASLGKQSMQAVRRTVRIHRGEVPEIQFDRPQYRPGDAGVVTVAPTQPNERIDLTLEVDGKKTA